VNDVINLAGDDGRNVRLRTKGKVASFVIAIAVLALLFSPYPGVSALTIDFSAITNISIPIPQDGPSIELSANLNLLNGQTLQIDHLEVIVDGDQAHPLIYDENGAFLGNDPPKVLVAKGTPFPTKGEITIGDGYGYGTGITQEGYLGPDTLPYVLEALPSQYAAGTHTLQFVAVDKDAQKIHSSEIEFTISLITAPAQITLSSLPNPSTLGQSITLTSTVTSGVAPSGTVTFYDGPTELGTVTLDSSGKAVLVTSALSVGSHDIFALYSGDAVHNPASSSAFQLIVNPPLDSTPPIITPAITGTLGNNGWYSGDVAVSWSVTDAESTITSPACAATTIAADTLGQTVTCTATSAGGTNSQSITIKRDATAPTITGAPTTSPNANGWYNSDVTVSYTASDSLSGIATLPSSTVISTDGASQSTSQTVTDLAGNSATATISGINLDKTAPTITAPSNIVVTSKTPVSPPLGSPTVSDNLDSSPVITNNAPAAFLPGTTTTVTWTVSDKAGNTASSAQSVMIQAPDSVFPEAYNQFDPASKDVTVYGTDNTDGDLGPITPVSITKTKWHTKYDDENSRQYDDDNDDEHDGQNDKNRGHSRATNAELRTYVITDHAGNSLTLTEVVKHKGDQIKVKVTSIQYGTDPAVAPKLATKYFEWSLGKNGSIKELEQKMTVGQGKTKHEVEAKYDSKKNQTKIKSEKPRSERTISGMILLQMHTDGGDLVIKDTS